MKKFFYLISLVVITLSSRSQDYQLVWSDEFDSGTVNMEKWNFETGNGVNGWGNNELQYYTNRPENIRIEDGKLIITAIKEDYNGFDYTSARIQSRNKGQWKYGRIEMRAKLPKGTGTWPAFWMMPQTQYYGTKMWPDNGEIDIMEYVGYMPDKVHGTVHTYNNYGSAGVSKTITFYGVEDDFHTYAIEWNADTIKWYVDSYMYGSYNRSGRDWQFWPFDRDFYMILNFAVGGNWGGAEGVDTSVFPQTYEIDYVRVYQKEYSDLETDITNDRINISSNPVNDVLHLAGLDDLQNYSITITDLQGKILFSQECRRQNEIDMDLSFLQAGVYFLLVKNLKTGKTFKIIKD